MHIETHPIFPTFFKSDGIPFIFVFPYFFFTFLLFYFLHVRSKDKLNCSTFQRYIPVPRTRIPPKKNRPRQSNSWMNIVLACNCNCFFAIVWDLELVVFFSSSLQSLRSFQISDTLRWTFQNIAIKINLNCQRRNKNNFSIIIGIIWFLSFCCCCCWKKKGSLQLSTSTSDCSN